VKSIDGADVKLDKYKGEVLLIVNVASKCGLTERNYKELEPLYEKYKDQGFTILGFPANDFMGQEPGTDEQIKEFCTKRDVKFPLFSKISVKGDAQAPLYKYLTTHPSKEIAGDVEWNFQKYLVGRDGKVIAKFSPRTDPSDPKLTAAIDEALKAPKPGA
jgi:glutathione peroxidase